MSPPPCADCVASYGSWSSCQPSCVYNVGDTGERRRSLSVSTSPQGEGTPCPAYTQYDSCSVPMCPLPCLVTQWSEWSPCSQTCSDLAFKQRVRSVYRAAMYGGAECPVVMESANCGLPDCPSSAPTPSPTPEPTPLPTARPTPPPSPAPAAAVSDAHSPAPPVADAPPLAPMKASDSGLWIGVGVGVGLGALALAFLAAACIIRRRAAKQLPIRVQNRASVAATLPPPLQQQPPAPHDERVIATYFARPDAPDAAAAPRDEHGAYQQVPSTQEIDKNTMMSAARERSVTGTMYRDADAYSQYGRLQETPIEYSAAPDFSTQPGF